MVHRKGRQIRDLLLNDMSMKKRYTIGIILAALLLVAPSAKAVNYVLGYSSVDNGEIRWGGSTQYSTQWNGGIGTWNARNKVLIAPDTIWTIEDVTVSDVSIPNEPWAGKHTRYIPGADTIEFNTPKMNGTSSAFKQNIATHELGHALGLDHHSVSGNVMYVFGSSQITLGTQDVNDYVYLWGN